MRSTLTIEDALDRSIRALAERERVSYKAAVNLTLQAGLERLTAAETAPVYLIDPFEAGLLPGIDSGKLNQAADDPDLA